MSFSTTFFFMQLIYFGKKPNEITIFFICCKIKEKKKIVSGLHISPPKGGPLGFL